MASVHFSSKTTEWGTPKWLFDQLNEEFHFTIDVCASHGRQMVERYWDPETDGLKQRWYGETCWMNPPYGREIKHWVEKARRAVQVGRATVVGLLPARTDTAWWHDHIIGASAEVRFLRGRLKFLDAKGVERHPAPFPSAIVIWY